MNRLIYRQLDSKELILDFKVSKYRIFKMSDIIIGSMKQVFLLKINYTEDGKHYDTYVFESWSAVRFLNDKKYSSKFYTFYLYEFDSYKKAYAEALKLNTKC